MGVDERKLLFSTALQRLEVGVIPTDSDEEGTVWSVHVRKMPGIAEDSRKGVLISGYLRRNGPEGFGQALAIGMLWERDIDYEKAEASRWEAFVAELEESFVESIYDTARRALQSQAGQMDFCFEIDAKAPPANIHIPVIQDQDPVA